MKEATSAAEGEGAQGGGEALRMGGMDKDISVAKSVGSGKAGTEHSPRCMTCMHQSMKCMHACRARRTDVHADAEVAIGQWLDGERVVEVLGGGRVNAEDAVLPAGAGGGGRGVASVNEHRNPTLVRSHYTHTAKHMPPTSAH